MNAPTPTIREVLNGQQATTLDHARSFVSALRVPGAKLRVDLTEAPFIGSSTFNKETGDLVAGAVERTFLESIPADGGTVKALDPAIVKALAAYLVQYRSGPPQGVDLARWAHGVVRALGGVVDAAPALSTPSDTAEAMGVPVGEAVAKAAASIAHMVDDWYRSRVMAVDDIPSIGARLIERRLNRFFAATHTANAGARPVGEAVAQKLFEAFAVPRGNVHGVWADYGEDGKAMFREVASHFLASIARPAPEAQDEVERLTRERDKARVERKAETRRADGFAVRAFAAEADLAETRERLGKVRQSPAIDGLSLAVATALVDIFGGEETDMTVQFIKDGHSGSGFYAWCTEYPEDGSEYLGSASEFSHRAALTGDTQEAGK